VPIVALWLALSAPALAASGYYAPQDVAVASQQFARAQATAGANFASLQARADALAAALVRYETALDLLGSDAPADQRTRQRDLQRRYLREQAVISAFANDQADAFGAAFEAALKRAIAARMDADPQLTRALEGLLSSGWPSFSLASTPQPAVGGASSHGNASPHVSKATALRSMRCSSGASAAAR
jgi:ATP phosphoribosyltransferase regulatory subunit HisZ